MEARRIRIPKAAVAELSARAKAHALAEQRLNDYLAGVVMAKGLKPEEVAGFDDVTNELILKAE